MKLIGLSITAAVLAGWQPACAQAQFDGHWTGTYECSPHAFKPLPNFSWPVSMDIKDGAISGQYAYQVRLANGGKAPATVTFRGTIDGTGDASITAIARKTDRTEDFHQTLVRSVATATEIRLTGPMLGQDDAHLRDCTLTLRAAAPTNKREAQVLTPMPSPPEPVAQPPRPEAITSTEDVRQQPPRIDREHGGFQAGPYGWDLSFKILNLTPFAIADVEARQSAGGATFHFDSINAPANASQKFNIKQRGGDAATCTYEIIVKLAGYHTVGVRNADLCVVGTIILKSAGNGVTYSAEGGGIKRAESPFFADKKEEYCWNQKQLLARMNMPPGDCNPQFDDKGNHIVPLPLPPVAAAPSTPMPSTAPSAPGGSADLPSCADPEIVSAAQTSASVHESWSNIQEISGPGLPPVPSAPFRNCRAQGSSANWDYYVYVRDGLTRIRVYATGVWVPGGWTVRSGD